jgi:hypothetical protein
MRLAVELRLPLLTVVDTAGAALSVEAEERGLAGEIARCLEDLVTLDAPVVSVLLGQGTGGAALALLPADRVVAARHAWLAPLPPEGRARSGTGTSRTPRRWPGRRASASRTWSRPASSTGWSTSGRTRPTSRSSSAGGSARCWRASSGARRPAGPDRLARRARKFAR